MGKISDTRAMTARDSTTLQRAAITAMLQGLEKAKAATQALATTRPTAAGM